MRQPLIAGNWKMHADLSAVDQRLQGLLAALEQVDPAAAPEVAVLAPFPYLASCQDCLQGSSVRWGAQNLCAQDPVEGAFTGEVSAAMLLEFGCRYVLIGHSERRQYQGESDEVLADKLQCALNAGLRPILCIGESLQEREAEQTEAVLQKQLAAVLTLTHNLPWRRLVIAYEPLWAIGTGVTASPQQAQDTHAFVRQWVAKRDPALAEQLRILYGGSVKPANCAALLAEADIDGALVGGASLDCESLMEIIKACNP